MNNSRFSKIRGAVANPVVANFGWLIFDKLARLVIGLVVGTWVVRYLGPHDYGILNYGLSVTVILGLFPTLGLDFVVRRELIQGREESGVLLGTTFWLKLGAGVVTYALTIVGALTVEPDRVARFVIIVSGLTLVQHAMFTFDVYFQSRLQARYSTWAQNLAFAVSSLGRVILILSHAPLEAFVLMLLVELPINSVLLVIFYRQSGGQLGTWRWNGSLARRLLAESWPLAVAGIATILFLRVDQVLLSKLRGATEVGQYAAAYRLFELCLFLPVALTASLTPEWLRARETSSVAYEQATRIFFNRIAMLAWAVALPGILLAPIVVPLLYGDRYRESAAIFAVLLAGFPAMALGVARQQYLINEGLPRLYLVTALAGMVMSITLNLLLIPRFGAMGAAVVSVIAQMSTGVLLSFVWRTTRPAGRWQLRALFGRWRLPASELKADAIIPSKPA